MAKKTEQKTASAHPSYVQLNDLNANGLTIQRSGMWIEGAGVHVHNTVVNSKDEVLSSYDSFIPAALIHEGEICSIHTKHKLDREAEDMAADEAKKK